MTFSTVLVEEKMKKNFKKSIICIRTLFSSKKMSTINKLPYWTLAFLTSSGHKISDEFPFLCPNKIQMLCGTGFVDRILITGHAEQLVSIPL